ncbi:hypothetical protein CAPTEDRAFT_228977 [Capitella teleta]|uniref:STI1 domain-containing protein n=1 Tax=Capitella teleta TaxID=283909 RepID=R7V7L8_CAPTE|nr:hypothetical protein CAPTEDRAFT_228977 [Capitella teleta]|eukprot:ELU12371.1 hypothetical protein CAPTEDRAFT_228977 [Capitella teleta]
MADIDEFPVSGPFLGSRVILEIDADLRRYDMPPPLEDVSELVQKVEALRMAKGASIAPSRTSAQAENLQKVKSTDEAKKSSDGGFGGFKKGFLFGAPTQKEEAKEKSKHDDIPFIKPKNPNAKNERLQMPEVQAAMDASEAFVKNKDTWLTEDLLKQVTSNPNLSKRLMDPTFMQAVTEFQTNPQAAMLKYQNNPEMQSFIRDFCRIMGNHLSNLPGNSTDQPPPIAVSDSTAEISVASSTNPKQATAEDERRMQDILANPEIRTILQDPRVQRLLEVLRTDPDKAQKILQSPDPEMAKMIRKLCEVGLLQFQS